MQQQRELPYNSSGEGYNVKLQVSSCTEISHLLQISDARLDAFFDGRTKTLQHWM